MFHDRLAELYLKMTADARKRGDSGEASILCFHPRIPLAERPIESTEKHEEVYAKLLRFIDTTDHYRPDRLYGLLPSDGML